MNLSEKDMAGLIAKKLISASLPEQAPLQSTASPTTPPSPTGTATPTADTNGGIRFNLELVIFSIEMRGEIYIGSIGTNVSGVG